MTKKIVFQLHILGPDITQEYTLKPGGITIGREPGNEIQLNYPKVSRRHARIECTDSMCMIIDLESANGTLVDGSRIPPNVPTPLANDSVILLDPVKLTVKHVVVDVAEERPRQSPEQRTVSRKAAEPPPEQEKPPKKVEQKEPPPEPPKKPPKEPPKLPPAPKPAPEKDYGIPPGLSERSIQLIHYLPGIYHTDFMERFLALFEAILVPIEWNIDNFDVYLKADSAPNGFLPWLSYWYDLAFDSTWSEEKRRQLLMEAHSLFARRGTRWALTRLLEIYTGESPTIIEFGDGLEPHTFKVVFSKTPEQEKNLIIQLIDANKPTHTTYQLEFKK